MPPTAAPPPYPFPDIAAAVSRGLVNADDLPRPGPDAARSPLKYAAMSQDFRTGAWKHLGDGDLPQASNKAWGLVAETVKAVSAQHGGIIHKHQSITDVAQELAQLSRAAGDLESASLISLAIMVAGRLHANFYENDLADDTILEGLIKCEEMSDRLYALFWPEGAVPAAPAA